MTDSIDLKKAPFFTEEMQLLSSYDYDLPPRLIAQSPTVRREDARLMFIDRQTDTIRHLFIRDFPSLLQPNDAIVLNNTKVLPARLIGFRTATQGQWEGLFLRFLPNGYWEIMSKTRGKLRNGETITLELPNSDAKKTMDQLLNDRSSNSNIDYLLEIIERTEEQTLIVKPLLQNKSQMSAEANCFVREKICLTPSLDAFSLQDNSILNGQKSNKNGLNIEDNNAFIKTKPLTATPSDDCNTQENLSQESPSHSVLSDFFPHSRQIEFSLQFLESVGWVPIPPYIRAGRMIPSDKDDYQTVFAQEPGAVAAPTAGLHFSEDMLEMIRQMGVALCPLTLHVGAGTFKPISVEHLNEHQMHSEFASISAETVQQLKERRQKGGRIIAIGTTSVRTLESASNCDSNGNIDSTGQNDFALKAFQGYTNLFIRPPYRFKSVDAMLTNFHLPKSTLLVLVRTFGGNDLLKRAYQEAVEHEYRFYSYGDAMIIF